MSIDQAIVAINIAINEEHQTGKMLAYIEDYTGSVDLDKTLYELSNLDVSHWRQQLQEQGVAL
jgi:hypothetical protein